MKKHTSTALLLGLIGAAVVSEAAFAAENLSMFQIAEATPGQTISTEQNQTAGSAGQAEEATGTKETATTKGAKHHVKMQMPHLHKKASNKAQASCGAGSCGGKMPKSTEEAPKTDATPAQ